MLQLRRSKGNRLGNTLGRTEFHKQVSEVCGCQHKEAALL